MAIKDTVQGRDPQKLYKRLALEIKAAAASGSPLSHKEINERVRALSADPETGKSKFRSFAQLEIEAGVPVSESLLVSKKAGGKAPENKLKEVQSALISMEKAQAAGEEPTVARKRLRKLLEQEGFTFDEKGIPQPPEDKPLSVAQNVALFGYGASMGLVDEIAGVMGAVSNPAHPIQGFRDARTINRAYMADAWEQNPEAARNQSNFGQLVGTAASLGTLGRLGTAGGAGRSVLEGPRPPIGTLRWGLLPPLLSPEARRIVEAMPPAEQAKILNGNAHLGQRPQEMYGPGNLPQFYQRQQAQEQQAIQQQQEYVRSGGPIRDGILDRAAGRDATDILPEGVSRVPTVITEQERELIRQGGSGNPFVDFITNPRAVAITVADQLPVLGDLIALGEVGLDVFHGEMDIGTLLALASVIPAVPRIRHAKTWVEANKAITDARRAGRRVELTDLPRSKGDPYTGRRDAPTGQSSTNLYVASDIGEAAEGTPGRVRLKTEGDVVDRERLAQLREITRGMDDVEKEAFVKQFPDIYALIRPVGKKGRPLAGSTASVDRTLTLNQAFEKAILRKADSMTPQQRQALSGFVERSNENERVLREAGVWKDNYVVNRGVKYSPIKPEDVEWVRGKNGDILYGHSKVSGNRVRVRQGGPPTERVGNVVQEKPGYRDSNHGGVVYEEISVYGPAPEIAPYADRLEGIDTSGLRPRDPTNPSSVRPRGAAQPRYKQRSRDNAPLPSEYTPLRPTRGGAPTQGAEETLEEFNARLDALASQRRAPRVDRAEGVDEGWQQQY